MHSLVFPIADHTFDISTYCSQLGSRIEIFSSALISSLAASLYFSTFFIIFKAM